MFELSLPDIGIRGERILKLADGYVRRKIPFCFVNGYDASVVPRRFASVPLLNKPRDAISTVEGVRALLAGPFETRCPRGISA